MLCGDTKRIISVLNLFFTYYLKTRETSNRTVAEFPLWFVLDSTFGTLRPDLKRSGDELSDSIRELKTQYVSTVVFR